MKRGLLVSKFGLLDPFGRIIAFSCGLIAKPHADAQL